MRIKELVYILEVSQLAPIHFYSDLNLKMVAYCKHLSNQEFDDYKNNMWSKENIYDENELGVYLPDISSDEMYELQMKGNPESVRIVIREISYLFKINISEFKLLYSLYVILHEVGHWLYFKASGKSSIEYALWDAAFRKNSVIYAEKVRSIPDNSIDKRKYIENYENMYKNIPSENEADKYVYENIREKFELLKQLVSK